MPVEFNPGKNAANLRKHGVALSEGDGVLADPMAVTIEDPTAEGERRFVTIGANVFGAVMVVVRVGRGEHIRIVSVRNAQARECRSYEQGI
jgi:hypothetical protein